MYKLLIVVVTIALIGALLFSPAYTCGISLAIIVVIGIVGAMYDKSYREDEGE